MTERTSRRSFITKAAAAAGAASVLTGAANSASAQTQKSGRTLKVGALCVGEYSFWSIWADFLTSKGSFGSPVLNMEISHVWDVDPKKAQAFADKWGGEVVKTYDGMIGKVDGVASGGLYEVPWQHRLFRPYLEAGMPCYVSRPWVNTLKDMDEMLDVTAKHNAPFIATATYEHYNEADALKARLKNVGTIKSVTATCGGGDFPHFHIQHMMTKILGYNVQKVSIFTDDMMKAAYLQETYLYSGQEKQPPYLCGMYSAPGPYIFHITIIGATGTEVACMPGNSSYFYRFATQLVDIQKTLEGKTYQPLDVVRKKFEIYLAASYSFQERGGNPVAVGSVPADWGPKILRPGFVDESIFKK
ncbi:MAG: hypothetical protein Q8O92_16445 [Candidatus Latescibacter sp.]|nr:hypothetical protein [Candidatus Latescibacter sp.]